MIDDTPFSDRFGTPMLDVTSPRSEIVRIDPWVKVHEFLTSAPPRDFYAQVVTPLQKRILAGRVAGD